MRNKASNLPSLSDKQLDCMRWVAMGKTSWETAAILGISERTVNYHIDCVCRTLEVKGRQAAITALFFTGQLSAANQVSGAVTPKITKSSAQKT